MTTRKRLAALAGAAALLLLAGCATPGPLHVYSLPAVGEERPIADAGDGNGGARDVPSFLETDDTLLGFAYDPFTDHFFLRLAPGNKIRVVDRPARAIKREFEIEGADLASGGDLAIRPRDGHVFFLARGGVVETTRLGKFVRTFALAGADAPIGLAIDTTRDRLLALDRDGRRVTVHDLQGARIAEFSLAETAGGSLAFDGEKRELYAPLTGRAGLLGVFDESGKLLRTAPAAGAFVDVGPRSFVRVF